MAGLKQEVWTGQISNNFYPDTSFLNYVKSFNQFVNNDVLHMAEAGVDPVVLVNNTTYPINVVERTDTPLSIDLDKFETENTVVRRAEAIQYSYDQLESVIYGHRNTLRTATGAKAAHAYSPASNGIFTPVLRTTGPLVNGFRKLITSDITRLKLDFDIAEIPLEKRYLVLDPRMVADLIDEDMSAFKDILDIKEGQPNRFAGFGLLQFTRNAVYNETTGVKKPFGASAVPLTDTYSSFAFQGDEVFKADGNVYMFKNVDDARERGTIVGFDKRFIAMTMRGKAVGAIIAAKS